MEWGWGAGGLPARMMSPQVSESPAAQLRRGRWLHQAGVHAEGKMGMGARLKSLDWARGGDRNRAVLEERPPLLLL